MTKRLLSIEITTIKATEVPETIPAISAESLFVKYPVQI
jgi:hypothetical protein